jgi:hypothetical protein
MISDIRHHPFPLAHVDHASAQEQCPSVETGSTFYFEMAGNRNAGFTVEKCA